LSEFGRAREKLKPVVDTNVFVSAIFWRGWARECLARFAHREFEIIVSEEILREFAETAWELKIELDLPQNPQPWLNWLNARATIMAPVRFTEPVCSDPEDDKFIGCALAGPAECIITRDCHLLQLGKPFGIDIVNDREFLRILRRRTASF
jgi:putative PIN family toxin of toxin-antitoxin system